MVYACLGLIQKFLHLVRGEKRLKKQKKKYFWSWYLWLYPTTDFLQADKELANPTATQQGFAQKISKKTYQISKKKTEISSVGKEGNSFLLSFCDLILGDFMGSLPMPGVGIG